MTKAIICDLDGTLVDVSDLRPWVTGKRKDFNAFHTLALDAKPIEDTVQRVDSAWNTGHDVILVTARSEKFREGTMDWLARWNVPYHHLFMRANKDYRRDYDVKKEIFLRDIMSLYDLDDIVYALDDNPSIISLWQEFDIPTIVVPGWED